MIERWFLSGLPVTSTLQSSFCLSGPHCVWLCRRRPFESNACHARKARLTPSLTWVSEPGYDAATLGRIPKIVHLVNNLILLATCWPPCRRRPRPHSARRTCGLPLPLRVFPVNHERLPVLLEGPGSQRYESQGGDGPDRFAGGAGDFAIEFGLGHVQVPC